MSAAHLLLIAFTLGAVLGAALVLCWQHIKAASMVVDAACAICCDRSLPINHSLDVPAWVNPPRLDHSLTIGNHEAEAHRRLRSVPSGRWGK